MLRLLSLRIPQEDQVKHEPQEEQQHSKQFTVN